MGSPELLGVTLALLLAVAPLALRAISGRPAWPALCCAALAMAVCFTYLTSLDVGAEVTNDGAVDTEVRICPPSLTCSSGWTPVPADAKATLSAPARTRLTLVVRTRGNVSCLDLPKATDDIVVRTSAAARTCPQQR